jgi:hypothetical protein
MTIEAMTGQLNQLKKELDDIHRSLSYKFMRFCASRIDALFPDGKIRGKLRKIAIASLRKITE